jgi:hypothetical protein
MLSMKKINAIPLFGKLYPYIPDFINSPLLLETEHWSTNNMNTNPSTKEIPISE